ncbi:GNAT family N-acetyltransferase [Roseovarius sp. CAU 1744]|uniref:GNAT family N-acetyltransferase n=1 Tax=Roseovarius sp. CAU 1744 TaxID=3140368 RepID=UPI00325BEB49
MEFTRASTLPAAPAALQQSAQYARALDQMGAHVETWIADAGSGPLARIQIVRRRFGPLPVSWVPRGPVWLNAPSEAARAEILRGLPRATGTAGLWIIAPDHPADTHLIRQTPFISPQHVAEIDLGEDAGARMARQHVKWRNRLRHAQRSGLRVSHRRFDPARDNHVIRRETDQQRARSYRALPAAFVDAWASANPRDSRLFTVIHDGAGVAHMLILLHHPVATYHIGWSGDHGRALSAHNLALWEAAAWLARKGYTRFDLGSVDTQNAPGLARFKIGSGAGIRALGPTCLYLPQFPLRRLIRHAAA